MRYVAWWAIFGIACRIATARRLGEWRFHIARPLMRVSKRLWRDEWSPNW